MNDITLYCPTYNSIKYIDGYIENLNNQISRNFNVLFIDNFSNDGSLDKIIEFQKSTDLKVDIIQEKSCVYEAWNIAIENINTKYCMNFNTDDRLMINAVKTYEYYINEYPEIDLFYGFHYFVSSLDPITITNLSFQWSDLIYYLKNQSDDILYHTINPCGPFPLVKTESVKKCGKFDLKYFSSADYDMWLRMYSSGYKLKKIDEKIGYFLHRPDSISQSRLNESEQHDIEIQNKYKNEKNNII